MATRAFVGATLLSVIGLGVVVALHRLGHFPVSFVARLLAVFIGVVDVNVLFVQRNFFVVLLFVVVAGGDRRTVGGVNLGVRLGAQYPRTTLPLPRPVGTNFTGQCGAGRVGGLVRCV